MTREEFDLELREAIEEHYHDSNIVIEDITVQKANGAWKGWAVREDCSPIAPTIYPSQIYEDYKNGVPFEEVKAGAIRVLDSSMKDAPDIPDISIENARKSISFSMVNAERNEEMLETCHIKLWEIWLRFLDGILAMKLHLQ